MTVNLTLTEQQLKCLMTGKRIPGSLFMERASNGQIVVIFNQYHRKSARRRNNQALLTLFGQDSNVDQRYKLYLSMPDKLGEYRVVELLEQENCEGKHLHDSSLSNHGDIMKWPNFENPLGSLSDAEMADIEEACLRGELSREDYETYVVLKNKKK